MAAGSNESAEERPVLYQICRAGDRFEVGDGPFDLSRLKALVMGRGTEGGYDAQPSEDTIRVADPWMSGRHAGIFAESGGHTLKDLGSTNGVILNGKRVDAAALRHGDIIETGRTFWVFVRLPLDAVPPMEPMRFGTMSTWSPTLAQQMGQLARAARGTQNILIQGEAGVGKAYCARAIHDVSLRSGRLVTVDCSITPRDRLGVELFGAQDARAGALFLSSTGSIFIHRIELLPMDMQAVLANALMEKRVVPRSGGKPLPVDVRVLCSTETDLQADIRRGKFDAALYSELTQYSVRLPSLRNRREDLGLLMDSLLQRAGGARSIARDACRALISHEWPRNVRELAKIIEGAAILAGESEQVDLQHLPGVIAARAALEEAPRDTPTAAEDEEPAQQAEPLDDDLSSILDTQMTDPDGPFVEDVRRTAVRRMMAAAPPAPPPPKPTVRAGGTRTAMPKVETPPPPPPPKIIRGKR